MDDYSKFDAATYLRTRYSNPEDGRSKFYLDCFHEFYQQYHTQWDHTKARLLEFGGGPVIVPLISAAPLGLCSPIMRKVAGNADEGKLLGCGAVQERFDIINLNGCLKTAVNSSSQYLTCLAKLKPLLKRGGLLIGVQLLEDTWWKVQEETYNCFPITEDTVTLSLQ